MAPKFQPTAISALKAGYDIIIIGAGGAGLVSALQASELGLRPAILEKMGRPGGNTMRASTGMNAAESQVQLDHKVVDSFESFFDETLKGGGGLNSRELLRYFTSHTALAIEWLARRGVDLQDLTFTGGMSVKRAHRPAAGAPVGAYLINGLLNKLSVRDVPVFTDVRVTKLIKSDSGAITGVEIDLPSGEHKQIYAQAVVLATGGFGANKGLLGEQNPKYMNLNTTNHEGATGDGLKIASDAGASLIDLNHVQVHPTVCQDGMRAFLIGEGMRGEGAILVDTKEGKRFVNELEIRPKVVEAMECQPDSTAFLIFGNGTASRVSKSLEFYDAMGLVKKADTLGSLALILGVPAQNLEATVERYNQATVNKDDAFGRSVSLFELDAPYHAIHVSPAVHYTMGGVRLDHHARVLDEHGKPVPGLYAAGEVTGGLHGNNRIGGNSIAETVVFGRQAGKQAFEYLSKL